MPPPLTIGMDFPYEKNFAKNVFVKQMSCAAKAQRIRRLLNSSRKLSRPEMYMNHSALFFKDLEP